MTIDYAVRRPPNSLQNDILSFLTYSDIVNEAGHVYSWINPDHHGYVYPEAMGLYLTLASQTASHRDDPVLSNRTHRVARRLQDMVPASGGIGKNGNHYLFDNCMAITGLLTYESLLGGTLDEAAFTRLTNFARELAERGCAVVATSGEVANVRPHWSTRIGASALKNVIAFDRLATRFNDMRYLDLAMEMADYVISSCFRDGVFYSHAATSMVYTHAHCYALEGLLHLHARGYRDTSSTLQAGADQLRDWQNGNGGLFNWNNAPQQRVLQVADATSQAVRIWIAVDRERYAANIERAIAFLASLRGPEGGLYYAPGSADVNSWSSLFAAQALEWHTYGPQPDQIV